MSGNRLQSLVGRIGNLEVSTSTVDVFITDADRTNLKITAGAAVLAGSVELGIGLLALDTDSYSEVDLMKFDLEQSDGTIHKIESCIWLCPFEEGDEVEVVAEPIGEVWKGVAVARPSDRLVAVYPLCTHGRRAHWKKIAKWWVWATLCITAVSVAISALIFIIDEDKSDSMFAFLSFTASVVLIGSGSIFAVIAWRVGRKAGKLVPLSEAIFRALGWDNPKSVDLYATTRNKRRPSDPEPMGQSYFRY